jgi:hypothetical protein
MNNRMRGRRHLIRVSVLTLALLGSAMLGRADILPGQDFTITYFGWGDTVTNPVVYMVTNVSDGPESLVGYTNGQRLPPDPLMDIDLGGDPMFFPPDSGKITIPQDTMPGPNGTEFISYVNNVGFDIQSLDFSTPFLDRFNGEIFSCDGNAFRDCGYRLVTDPNTGEVTLDIRFSGPTVPEPSSWLLLATVVLAIAFMRIAPFAKRS